MSESVALKAAKTADQHLTSVVHIYDQCSSCEVPVQYVMWDLCQSESRHEFVVLQVPITSVLLSRRCTSEVCRRAAQRSGCVLLRLRLKDDVPRVRH